MASNYGADEKGHHGVSVVVNQIHLYECTRCGARRYPIGGYAGSCPGPVAARTD